jgi:hypothetical protein
MKLLVDTDAFCKLGVAALLPDAALIFGSTPADCGRLPALPRMLRRGGLRKRFGAESCDALIPTAEAMSIVPDADTAWLDKFVAAEGIDPGEAQLLAISAEQGIPILSGDKRALRVVKSVDGLAAAIAGRVVVMEAILLALCDQLGTTEVRRRLAAISGQDVMIDICFSSSNADPREALRSYSKSLAAEVEPLVLWVPPVGRDS